MQLTIENKSAEQLIPNTYTIYVTSSENDSDNWKTEELTNLSKEDVLLAYEVINALDETSPRDSITIIATELVNKVSMEKLNNWLGDDFNYTKEEFIDNSDDFLEDIYCNLIGYWEGDRRVLEDVKVKYIDQHFTIYDCVIK